MNGYTLERRTQFKERGTQNGVIILVDASGLVAFHTLRYNLDNQIASNQKPSLELDLVKKVTI